MDVCDKVTSEESGGKDVVASMIKRLAHRNANVQLYTLEVRAGRPRRFTDQTLTFFTARKRTESELRGKDAQGVSFESIYRRPTTTSERSKLTPAGEG